MSQEINYRKPSLIRINLGEVIRINEAEDSPKRKINAYETNKWKILIKKIVLMKINKNI
jgi:hypothetical protein